MEDIMLFINRLLNKGGGTWRKYSYVFVHNQKI